MRNALKTALLAALVGSAAALWSGNVSAWESESYSGDSYYYGGYGYDHVQHSGYGHYPSHAEHSFQYSDGTAYGGYYRPHYYDTSGYGYAEQCVRYVRVYDDYGGWVWGRQLVC